MTQSNYKKYITSLVTLSLLSAPVVSASTVLAKEASQPNTTEVVSNKEEASELQELMAIFSAIPVSGAEKEALLEEYAEETMSSELAKQVAEDYLIAAKNMYHLPEWAVNKGDLPDVAVFDQAIDKVTLPDLFQEGDLNTWKTNSDIKTAVKTVSQQVNQGLAAISKAYTTKLTGNVEQELALAYERLFLDIKGKETGFNNEVKGEAKKPFNSLIPQSILDYQKVKAVSIFSTIDSKEAFDQEYDHMLNQAYGLYTGEFYRLNNPVHVFGAAVLSKNITYIKNQEFLESIYGKNLANVAQDAYTQVFSQGHNQEKLQAFYQTAKELVKINQEIQQELDKDTSTIIKQNTEKLDRVDEVNKKLDISLSKELSTTKQRENLASLSVESYFGRMIANVAHSLNDRYTEKINGLDLSAKEKKELLAKVSFDNSFPYSKPDGLNIKSATHEEVLAAYNKTVTSWEQKVKELEGEIEKVQEDLAVKELETIKAKAKAEVKAIPSTKNLSIIDKLDYSKLIDLAENKQAVDNLVKEAKKGKKPVGGLGEKPVYTHEELLEVIEQVKRDSQAEITEIVKQQIEEAQQIWKLEQTLNYEVHVQNKGWLEKAPILANGKSTTIGTTGKALHVEAVKLYGGFEYRTHVRNIGWQPWQTDGKQAGTTGKNLNVESIEIKLTGALAENYRLEYRAHVRNKGWQTWQEEGGSAGTVGKALPVEAIQVRLFRK